MGPSASCACSLPVVSIGTSFTIDGRGRRGLRASGESDSRHPSSRRFAINLTGLTAARVPDGVSGRGRLPPAPPPTRRVGVGCRAEPATCAGSGPLLAPWPTGRRRPAIRTARCNGRVRHGLALVDADRLARQCPSPPRTRPMVAACGGFWLRAGFGTPWLLVRCGRAGVWGDCRGQSASKLGPTGTHSPWRCLRR